MPEQPDLPAEGLLPNGIMIDNYKIVKFIVRGGMKDVYLAIDTVNKRANPYVALKILDPQLAGQDITFIKRFLREAGIASQIIHPNLAQVFECRFNDKNAFYYFAEEYISKGSLSELVSTNYTLLSEAESLRVAVGVARALIAVHQRGIVHRDIKPDNIMFTANGTVKLTDWGIAKQENVNNLFALMQPGLTINQDFMGTLLYASPEQIQNPQRVDIRSDIYSLGATIYYSLVRQPPFVEMNAFKMMNAVVNTPPPDVRKARPDVSDKLADLLQSMLSKSQDARPANPEMLLERLLDVGQQHLPVEVAQPALSEPPAGQTSSNAFTGAIVFILLLTFLFFASERWVQMQQPESRFGLCMEMGEAALQSRAWQNAMFYYRSAIHITGFENDRRPDQGIIKAIRGLEFEQKTSAALQIFSEETDKSKTDGDDVANMQLQSAVDNSAPAMHVPGVEQESEAQELLQAAGNKQRFHELLSLGQSVSQAARKSGAVADWQKVVDALKTAMNISGIGTGDLAVAGKALQNAEAGLVQVQQDELEKLFQTAEENLEKEEFLQAEDLAKKIRQTPFSSNDDLRKADELAAKISAARLASERAMKFQGKVEEGQTAFTSKEYLQAEKLFLEALSVPGYQNNDDVLNWLGKVRTAHFESLITQAKDVATPADQAFDILHAAGQIPGISDEQRQTVAKIREEIHQAVLVLQAEKLQQKYESLVAEADKLLADVKVLADYSEVEKQYQEATQLEVADRGAAQDGLKKCRRLRIHFLFEEGDQFAAMNNWGDAVGCYKKILFVHSADPEDKKTAEEKIIYCRKQELSLLLARGQEALQREDWQDSAEAYRQAIENAAGDFPSEKALAQSGLDFQRHFVDGRSLLQQKKYKQAIEAFDWALKISEFEKHPGALKNLQEAQKSADEERIAAQLREAEAKKKAEKLRYDELIAQAEKFLEEEKFADSNVKYKAAGEVPGYAQDPQIAVGLDKSRNGLLFQAKIRDLEGTIENKDWHAAEKILQQALALPGYQTDPHLLAQLKNVQDTIFQNHFRPGKESFEDQHWEEAVDELQKAQAVEGYAQHPEVLKYLDPSRKMQEWLPRFRIAENDFRKILICLREKKYFMTGAMEQDYIVELKNVWTEACGCPVEIIRQGHLDVLWREEIVPGLTETASALLYHTQVLSLTDELQAHARRNFLALIAEVDGICQGKINSLDEKSELRINVTKFFLIDYFHPILVQDPNDLSEDPRRISWLAELFQ